MCLKKKLLVNKGYVFKKIFFVYLLNHEDLQIDFTCNHTGQQASNMLNNLLLSTCSGHSTLFYPMLSAFKFSLNLKNIFPGFFLLSKVETHLFTFFVQNCPQSFITHTL